MPSFVVAGTMDRLADFSVILTLTSTAGSADW